MTSTDRRAIGLLAAFTAAALVLGTSPRWAPYLGSRMEWLRIERVEITGTRLLDPREVLAASGIDGSQHLLDDSAPWKASLLAHPVIDNVRIRRRPPGTLKIEVTEKRPVALVSDEALRFATADAEVLPVDPFAAPLDLPVLKASLEDSASVERTRAALAEIERLNTLAPGLMREISEVSVSGERPYVLTLTHPTSIIQLPIGATPERIEELNRTLADVERRFPIRPGRGRTPPHRIDLRFDDQIVVRPSSSAERS